MFTCGSTPPLRAANLRKLDQPVFNDADADSKTNSGSDDDSWNPKKSNPIVEDACHEFKEKYTLRAEDLHFLHLAFSLQGTLVIKYNAVPYDYLVNIINDAPDNTPWVTCIVNTAPMCHNGIHWNLSMWRLQRKRLQITLWEPYSHTKYSAHIKAVLVEAFPDATIKSFATGVQKQGDG